jgi:hypothetical protein
MSHSKHALLVTTVLLLSACGGGGGGGSSTPAPTPPSSSATNDSAAVDEDASTTIDVLANDTGVTASSLEISVMPGNGSATVNSNAIDYTPDADFSGTDSLTYTVNSSGGSTLSATVTITVNGVNDLPVANADSAVLIEDTPTALDVSANDTDIDGNITSVAIVTPPTNGTTTIDGAIITYTPTLDFTGSDELTYQAIDSEGGTSNSVAVSLTISALTETQLSITELVIPTDNYATVNLPEFNQDVLASASQTLEIPPNTVSFILSLEGDAVDEGDDALFLADLQSPDGDLPAFRQLISFCDPGLCTAAVPRRPDLTPTRGSWTFQLGTFEPDLNDIDTVPLRLRLAARTGPEPDPMASFPATITIKPFLTATSISEAELDVVLDRLVSISAANKLNVNLMPTTVLTDPRFTEVSIDFNDALTGELVAHGDPSAVNIFFLESFTGPNGGAVLGISGGIPGTQGIATPFNGVLINALATRGGPDEFYIRNTAQASFHEMGHHLGLYHTTESDFSFNDVLDDTLNCERDVHDENGNGFADLGECPDAVNPMFWRPDLLTPTELLSGDQQHVLFRAPIAVP